MKEHPSSFVSLIIWNRTVPTHCKKPKRPTQPSSPEKMTTQQYHFIQGVPTGASKKDARTEQSKARSHAAKIVIERRKKEVKFESIKSSTQGMAPQFKDLVHRWSGSRAAQRPYQRRQVHTFNNNSCSIPTEDPDSVENNERRDVPGSLAWLAGYATHQLNSAFSDYSCSPGLRIDPFYSIEYSRDKFIAKTIDFCQT